MSPALTSGNFKNMPFHLYFRHLPVGENRSELTLISGLKCRELISPEKRMGGGGGGEETAERTMKNPVSLISALLQPAVPTSPDSRQADVDGVSVSGSLVHQSQTPELCHLPPVQELLTGTRARLKLFGVLHCSPGEPEEPGRTSMPSNDRLQEISNFFINICSFTL